MAVARPRRGRVTIKDVAQRAGVSISTVSHVFSRARPISAVTRDRVLAAARELGYRADPTARSLRTGTHGLLGLVLRPRYAVAGSLAGSETFTRFSGACAAATLATGRGLVHVPDVLADDSHQVPMDGCIVEAPYGDDEVVAQLRARGIPVVTADVDPDHPDDPWAVVVDYPTVVTALLEDMAGSGARRIAVVTGTEDNAWNRQSAQAAHAWSAAQGVPVQVRTLFEEAGVDGSEAFCGELLDAAERPEGLVVAPSRFAVGAMRAAASRGLDVPGDLRVAALTDSDATRLHTPPITALDLRMEELGVSAVQLLLRMLAGEDPPDPRPVLVPHVRRRATT